MEKENIILIIFSILFILSLFMIIQGGLITGFATSAATISNVSIVQYWAIDLSTNLSAGIIFGSVNTLPSANINATHNYDDGTSASSMFVNVSRDSNTAVDLCTKVNQGLYDSSGANLIGPGNESYANATSTSLTSPALARAVNFTTSYVQAGKNVAIGTVNYYRFWLYVPAGTLTGNYNNTVHFDSKQTGTACT